MLDSDGNSFEGFLDLNSRNLVLRNQGTSLIRSLVADSAFVESGQQILLVGNINLGEGNSQFIAHGDLGPVARNRVADLLPQGRDVFSGKIALDPTGNNSVLNFSDAAILQVNGVLTTRDGGLLSLQSTSGSTISLVRANQIRGLLEIQSGGVNVPYAYDENKGLGLASVSNSVDLRLGGRGIEADVVSVSAPRLGTTGEAQIRARLPYDDVRFGVNRSYPALVLAIGGQTSNGLNIQNSGFVSDGTQRFTGIKVNIGNDPVNARNGFATVLPFEGAALVPGVVVFLEGPQTGANYSFFYDGAGSPLRVPISYNGVIPLGTSANNALTQVTSLASFASNRQRENVVQTENVTLRLRSGAVFEAGPGRPATSGTGSIKLPQECNSDDSGC